MQLVEIHTTEDKTMKDHPFVIHLDGSVSYNNTTYDAKDVEELVEAVKNEIDETESHLGSFAGHQVKMLSPKYTHLKIGCQAFHADCIKAFIEDYEKRTRELKVKIGDRLIHKNTGEEYIVAKADKNQISLIHLGSGNCWAAPVNVAAYGLPTPLSRLVGSRANQFKFKE